MVIVFYGTGAELIKMLGIVQLIPRDQQLLICTAQQNHGLQSVHAQLGIEPDLYLGRGWKNKDVENMKQMLGLMLGVHSRFAMHFRSLKKQIRLQDEKNKTKSIVLVHGDTLTTVVGSYLGRILGLPVGHVEAGLRSGSWKSPFPEELDRRIVSKIARIHFTPTELAEKNLLGEKTKGIIVDTKFNTAKDAIVQADKFVSRNFESLKLPKKYTVILLHRTELLENRSDLEEILIALRDHADNGNNLVFTMHSTTKARIKSYGFEHYLNHQNIRVIPKQPYFDFMAIVKNSEAVVTDGGGLQEDTFFLGIPSIVHRARTERQEGLGLNSSLSEMSVDKVTNFLNNHPHKDSFKQLIDNVSPSRIVVDFLSEKNYINMRKDDQHA